MYFHLMTYEIMYIFRPQSSQSSDEGEDPAEGAAAQRRALEGKKRSLDQAPGGNRVDLANMRAQKISGSGTRDAKTGPTTERKLGLPRSE